MFMHSSIREANSQALLSDDDEVHSHVDELVKVYKDICSKDVCGTCLAHMVDAVHLTQQEPNAGLVYDGMCWHESCLSDSIFALYVWFLKCHHQGFGQ